MIAGDPDAEFLAGGTSQVDLMKEGVQRPRRLIDISQLGLDTIEMTESGGWRVGANVKNAVLAGEASTRGYDAISEALHAGASPQIRNMASMAGNLLQRTRCPYLRDPDQACNKRRPGSGCAAIAGYNRMHAIFGYTDEGATGAHSCIAVHPSDVAVALVAHDATLLVQGPAGNRTLPAEELWRLPGSSPERDATLEHGELIRAIELPPFSGRSRYLKVRDRASYAYALVSCAVAVEVRDGVISMPRIVLGSVAARPWRARSAEALLDGEAPSEELFRAAAQESVRDAHTFSMNDYKPQLAAAITRRALAEVTGLRNPAGPSGTAFAASVGGIAGEGTI